MRFIPVITLMKSSYLSVVSVTGLVVIFGALGIGLMLCPHFVGLTFTDCNYVLIDLPYQILFVAILIGAGIMIMGYLFTRHEDKWHKHNPYLTAVAIYLLVSVGIVLSVILYFDYLQFRGQIEYSGVYQSLREIIPLNTTLMLGIVVPYSIIGSLELLRKHRYGLYVSLIALIFMTFSFPINTTFLVNTLVDFSFGKADFAPIQALFFLSVGSALAMCPLLAVGWKKARLN